MAISARLSRTIHRALGDEAGEDLINWMGQVEANRSELRELMEAWAARTDGRFEALVAKTDSRFAESAARVDMRFAESAAHFDKQFAESASRMDQRFSELKECIGGLEIRMERQFADLYKWSFVFWCGAIGFAVIARILIR